MATFHAHFMEKEIHCSNIVYFHQLDYFLSLLITKYKSFQPINPILHGGGHYGPDDRRSSVVSLWIALRLPNFFTLFLSMFYKSQKSHFQKKKKFREKYRTLSKISIYDMQAISFLLAWVWLRPQNANVRGKNTTLNCQKQSC